MASQQTTIPDIVPPKRGGLGAARIFSTIVLIAGAWYFISPWVFGTWRHGVAFNNWFAAALIVWFAIARVVRPAYSTAMCWANMVMGIWVFCSPWIYGYANFSVDRLVNSLAVGFAIFVCSVIGLRISAPRIPASDTLAARNKHAHPA